MPLAAQTLLDVLPRSVDAEVREGDSSVELVVGDQRLRIGWAGGGSLRDVRELLARGREEFDIVTGRRLSPAARELLADAAQRAGPSTLLVTSLR